MTTVVRPMGTMPERTPKAEPRERWARGVIGRGGSTGGGVDHRRWSNINRLLIHDSGLLIDDCGLGLNHLPRGLLNHLLANRLGLVMGRWLLINRLCLHLLHGLLIDHWLLLLINHRLLLLVDYGLPINDRSLVAGRRCRAHG